jgi:hypothetical protein
MPVSRARRERLTNRCLVPDRHWSKPSRQLRITGVAYPSFISKMMSGTKSYRFPDKTTFRNTSHWGSSLSTIHDNQWHANIADQRKRWYSRTNGVGSHKWCDPINQANSTQNMVAVSETEFCSMKQTIMRVESVMSVCIQIRLVWKWGGI